MATLTSEQIQEKKQQIAQKLQEIRQLHDEIVAAGVEISDDELDAVNGGGSRKIVKKSFI